MRKDNPVDKRDIKAFLGPGSRFEGKLIFDEIVRIDGVFRGEIESKDILIIGPGADIQAEVSVGTLIVSGTLHGNVKALNKVELRAPAQVEGTLQTPALTVEEGVVLNGTLAMIPAESV
ncbi:bactofilin family protein [Trichloromonas sp.]|uniref:bactofilin family protein n=1 Tax=Trichloromonas sp. TaxID=3069249 RepID=UPI002A3810F1|nr:polymer-forming cytoskeletal protein [Trichloromonas sp.]